MSIVLSLSERLTYSTVRIECELASGGISTGTGFFCRFADKGEQHVPAIVTNKHVIEGARRGQFHLHRANAEGEPLPLESTPILIEDFSKSWILHPEKDVDLCIMPIAGLLNQAHQQGHRFFYIPLDKSLIPTSEELVGLTAMEDVVMIGYPNGIWDEINNMPIIRRGITATHPNLNYNGNPEFMIDAACFPGSSGSPVFLFNQGSYPDKLGNLNIGNRIKLLGVLYAGPQHTATGEIEIVNVPTQQRAVAFSRIPNNLGSVIKSQKLSDFETILEKMS